MAQEEKTEIITVESTPLGIPMMPIEQLKLLTAYVNDVKKTLMIAGKDYVIDGNRQYTARSGFAKLHQGFMLSDDKPEITKIFEDEPVEYTFKHKIRKEWKTETFQTRIFGFEAKVRVINLETGRYGWGEGACTISELAMTHNLSPKWYHRCLGTAKTRAWNRAVSNYVGSAEVSAEEMGLEYTDDEPSSARQVPAQDVRIGDYMKPAELKHPETQLIDELARFDGNWEKGVKLTEEWMKLANINPADFNISSDHVKLTVAPKKIILDEMKDKLQEIMKKGGFVRTTIRNVPGWRLNINMVTGARAEVAT